MVREDASRERAEVVGRPYRPWREFDDEAEANNPNNLVSLCRRCHAKKARYENRWLRGDGLALQEYRRFIGLGQEPLTELGADGMLRLKWNGISVLSVPPCTVVPVN